MHDLEAFCFRHGIKVGRLADARNIVWFANSKKIPMRDFSKAAPWVDVTDPNFVKPPTHRESVGMYFIVGILLGLAALVVSVGDSRSAMLTTKDSQVTFLAGADGIRSLSAKDISIFGRSLISTWNVPMSACQDTPLVLAQNAGFTNDESRAICTSMFDGTLDDQISRSVKFQRQTAAVVALIFMACACMLLLHVLRGISARKLLKRILDLQRN